MRLLIYGFGPYLKFPDNITEKILRRLPAGRNLQKIIFPVRFQRRQFLQAIKSFRPDTILGLGQRSRGWRLKIEMRAVNRRRRNKKERPKPIVSGGSKGLGTSLKIIGGRQARISYNAGDYVCNYSMYVILDYLKRHHLPTRFGFIHVPHHYNLAKADRFLKKAVKEMK